MVGPILIHFDRRCSLDFSLGTLLLPETSDSYRFLSGCVPAAVLEQNSCFAENWNHSGVEHSRRPLE